MLGSATSCSPSGSSRCSQTKRGELHRTSCSCSPVALPGAQAPELQDFSEISTKHPCLNRCQPLGTIPSIPPLVVLAIASVFGATGQIPEGACWFTFLFETYARPFAALRPQAQYLIAPSAHGPETLMDHQAERGRVARALQDGRIRPPCCPQPGVDDVASRAAVAFSFTFDALRGAFATAAHVGAAMHQSNPLRPSSRRSKPRGGHIKSRPAFTRNAAIGKPFVCDGTRSKHASRTSCRNFHAVNSNVAQKKKKQHSQTLWPWGASCYTWATTHARYASHSRYLFADLSPSFFFHRLHDWTTRPGPSRIILELPLWDGIQAGHHRNPRRWLPTFTRRAHDEGRCNVLHRQPATF